MRLAEVVLAAAIGYLVLGLGGLGCVDNEVNPIPLTPSLPNLPEGHSGPRDAATVVDVGGGVTSPPNDTSGGGCDLLAQDCPGGQGANLACYPSHGIGTCQVITGFSPVGSFCSLDTDCDRGLVCGAQSRVDETSTVCQPICALGQAISSTCLDGQVCTRIGGFDTRSNAGYCTLP